MSPACSRAMASPFPAPFGKAHFIHLTLCLFKHHMSALFSRQGVTTRGNRGAPSKCLRGQRGYRDVCGGVATRETGKRLANVAGTMEGATAMFAAVQPR